ncbi:hypothetical protein C8J57DRAFT_1468365 [Mycena rebaudengoi]|nr:hypothetical protein C8J57DRAFT_1468365 [Mycena rebaudengoi]
MTRNAHYYPPLPITPPRNLLYPHHNPSSTCPTPSYPSSTYPTSTTAQLVIPSSGATPSHPTLTPNPRVCAVCGGLCDAGAGTGVRWGGREQSGVACAAAVCGVFERHAPLAADTTSAPPTAAQYSTTPQYATTMASTPQYTTLGATPRTLTARYEYLGGTGGAERGGWAAGRVFFHPRVLALSSVSTSTSGSESCSASEESTPESESEGEEGEEEEEEGYNAPAYTERTTKFATRHTPAADFAEPYAHRPMASLSSPASDKGDAEMVYVPGSSKARVVHADHRAAPQHTDHNAAGSSGDTRVEQTRRIRRLRVVPADPSAHAYRPQRQVQQLQPQYGCVGGGGWGRITLDSSSRGGGQQPDAAHDAPGAATPAACPGAPATAYTAPTAYAATPATPAPAARHPGSSPARAHDDAVDAPAPRVRGDRARAVDPATAAALCRFGAVESGGGGGGSVARPAGPLACAASPLARPRAARAHARPLAHAPSARPARANADAAPCLRMRAPGGERVYQVTPPFYVLLADYPAVPPSSRPLVPPTPTSTPTPTGID